MKTNKNRIPARILLFAGWMTLAGCHQGSPTGAPPDFGIVPGKVTEQVRCQKHPAFSYAIYLPSGYSSGDSLPVFLAFDPGGSGVRLVTKYKDLAEQYHFILIGSNDSRNGQTVDQIEQIAFAMLMEIRNRYATGDGHIYCMGFSGGSRVSSIIAFYRGGIKGVIGCGAGLPAFGIEPRYRTNYYGLVGNRDFNFLEMVLLERQLSEMGYLNSLHVFDGKHAWPPPEEIGSGIRWHLYQAMKEGSIEPDSILMAKVLQQTLFDRLTNSAIDPKSLEKEKKQQNSYSEAMKQQPLPWWRKQVEKLNQPADSATSILNQRLLAYCSMLAYTYSAMALQEKNGTELSRIISIYETVDPENEYIPHLKEQLNTLSR
ncbi:MAG: hypothetical protein D4R67_08610 [Bacteroidetes bacterium]|nr:MAG: hypothetical protein D4R67_08610 [Bacteroidota bacterium]